MSQKKQTALEWYIQERNKFADLFLSSDMSVKEYHDIQKNIEAKALAMEKEQIAKSVQWCLSGVMDEESALNEGHKFYNEAFQRAYGVDEPDYNNIIIRNKNPDYKP